MWVDAIQTRANGRKLPPERLEAMRPVRGRLWVSVLRRKSNGDRVLTASLLGERGTTLEAFRQLDDARVKIRDGQILVLGYEDHGTHPKSPRLVPQVWWCDPVRDPIDEVEAMAKARFPPTRGRARQEVRQVKVPAWVDEVRPAG